MKHTHHNTYTTSGQFDSNVIFLLWPTYFCADNSESKLKSWQNYMSKDYKMSAYISGFSEKLKDVKTKITARHQSIIIVSVLDWK